MTLGVKKIVYCGGVANYIAKTTKPRPTPKPKRKRKASWHALDMQVTTIQQVRCPWCQKTRAKCSLCNGHGYLRRKAVKK